MKTKKQQVVFIHGGSTFSNRRDYLKFLENLEVDLDKYRKTKWSEALRRELGRKFDVLLLKMPNPTNACYREWNILFGKIALLLDDNVILVGHSLGGIFLVKYLAMNKFPRKISATFLISAPYDDNNPDEPLVDFALPKNLERFVKQVGQVFLYHSQDDEVVPYSHFEKYKKLLPNAHTREFKKRGHFNQERFPELVEDIKKTIYN